MLSNEQSFSGLDTSMISFDGSNFKRRRDGQNWYNYVSNNPLRFTDSTGLRIDDDLDTDLKRKAKHEEQAQEKRKKKANNSNKSAREMEKELAVRTFFPYMDGYKLTGSEIDNYHKLAILGGQIKEATSAYGKNSNTVEALQEDYNELLLNSLHTQYESGMVPLGGDACYYRTLQAGVEYISGRPMPMSIINHATEELYRSGALPYLKRSDSYRVKYPNKVLNTTIELLGLKGIKGNITKPKPIDPYMAIGGDPPENPYGLFYIRQEYGHFNLGDYHADFLWDPSSGRKNLIEKPIGYRPVWLGSGGIGF